MPSTSAFDQGSRLHTPKSNPVSSNGSYPVGAPRVWHSTLRQDRGKFWCPMAMPGPLAASSLRAQIGEAHGRTTAALAERARGLAGVQVSARETRRHRYARRKVKAPPSNRSSMPCRNWCRGASAHHASKGSSCKDSRGSRSRFTGCRRERLQAPPAPLPRERSRLHERRRSGHLRGTSVCARLETRSSIGETPTRRRQRPSRRGTEQRIHSFSSTPNPLPTPPSRPLLLTNNGRPEASPSLSSQVSTCTAASRVVGSLSAGRLGSPSHPRRLGLGIPRAFNAGTFALPASEQGSSRPVRNRFG